MRSLTLRWLVLLFSVAWFGVLVPVHQRGAIQLPGFSAASCCTHRLAPTSASSQGSDSQKPDAPAKGSSGNCAVCYLVFGLDLPAPVMLDVPPLGLAEPVARFDLPAPAEREHVRSRCERGPPLA